MILPAIPLAMASGFLFIILSFMSPVFANFLSMFVWLILTYVIEVVRFMSQISGAQLLLDIPLSFVWLLYFMLTLFIIYLYRFELKRLRRKLKLIF